MDFELTTEQLALQSAVAKICAGFDPDYWLERDRDGRFPEEFVQAVAAGGWFGATIPTEYGGAGLGMTEAALIMREIGRLGGAATTSTHINIFGPHPLVKFGTEEQKARNLPRLIAGTDRASFSVTEPDAGLNTTRITTFARRQGDRYIVNGRKLWTSNAQVANKIILLARTTKFEDVARPTDGMTLFYTDFDRSRIEARKIDKMMRNAVDSSELFIDNLEIPVEDRIGEEGRGFEYLLHSINPERIVVSSGIQGATQQVLDMAAKYARERIVFDRPIGMNQSIQHPLAEVWAQLRAAELMLMKAASLYDAGKSCGLECNAAKYLSAEAYFKCATRAVQTHGGMGVAKEFHVERYFRESILTTLAPVSQELALCFIAERALGLPKSY
ncbi:MAG: acyl-CoA dehydrogenase family protein [Burkholderiaceae bacterium]|nr:acyl-CoA dehydrogenase family protein [Burkholderiaceae bacterium]